jgi:hypothetical protein
MLEDFSATRLRQSSRASYKTITCGEEDLYQIDKARFEKLVHDEVHRGTRIGSQLRMVRFTPQ